MRKLEESLQIRVAHYLDLVLPKNAWWFHTPNGGKRHIAVAAKLKAQGAKSGVPDCTIIYQGRAYFIELKTETGRLSQTQKEVGGRLAECGACFAVCRSLNDVQMTLNQWNIPTKGVIQ